jgi:stalled ribosome rescue protein Dom34
MNMTIRHAAVWLDHEEARIFHIDRENFEQMGVQVRHHLRRPTKTGGPAETHRDISEEHPFFDEVAKHLSDVEEVLVVGPADTKLAFVKYVELRHKDLAKKVVGVEACDHPSDGALIAEIRKHFIAIDRVRA